MAGWMRSHTDPVQRHAGVTRGALLAPAAPVRALGDMPAALRYLQRTAGNQAVSQLVRRYFAVESSRATQARQSDEPGEAPAPWSGRGHPLQRQTAGDELQLEPAVGAAGGPLSPALASRLQQARGGGTALDSSVRARMEDAFGTSFAGVRVHTDAESDTLNRSVSATAFTTGNDIFFRQGVYQPGSSAGNRLLAHELTHVVQQRSMSNSAGGVRVGPADDTYEREAGAIAAEVAANVERGTDEVQE